MGWPKVTVLDAARQRRGRRRLFFGRAGLLALCALVFAPPSIRPANAQSDGFVEERIYLRVKVKEKTVRLEAMLVKRADLKGRLPVALWNHGRPGYHSRNIAQGYDGSVRGITRDLARRGWLAVAVNRRGFGLSDGAVQSDNHLPCKDFDWALKRTLGADADDLEAALALIASRPDADVSRLISLGHSAGGGASIELGARNVPGLLFAVSIAGGYTKGQVGSGNVARCDIEELVRRDFRELGSRGRIPQLWFYADNDPGYSPADVELARASFAGGGGNVRVKMMGVLGDNGHEAMVNFIGRNEWLPELDAYLRSRGLPTWPLSNVDTVMQRLGLSEARRKFVETYLSRAGEMAMAKSTRTGATSYAQALTLESARATALRQCDANNAPCVIVMENDRFVGN